MSISKSHIVVPETFPSILKTYVKDAMRTQPYDLLAWSAAYFRCIADDIQPPTKIQYEENTQEMLENRSLTKEYLKVLVKQIGKGFFVERTVLQARWKSLGLSQDDLLAFLNLCGMIEWDRIHWLELLTIISASMCKDFPSSINFICELLTDEADGGSKSIPVWMFSTCYLYLAQFDSNSKGEITKNRTSIEPTRINAQHFRTELLTEWKACVKFSDGPSDSSISVDFDRMKETNNFDELIQVLSELQTNTKNTVINDDGAMKEINAKWKYAIIRRIGAPWNWIYQFVDHYLPFWRSYNFYECHHKLFASESLKNLEISNLPELDIVGAGTVIPPEITDEFLDFIKIKARENDGMISPEFFTDEKCPRIF